MASQPGGFLYGPFQDNTTGQSYWYDSQSDEIIRQDGTRQQRPASVPRAQFMRYAADASQFQYLGSPSSQNVAYTPSPIAYSHSTSAGSPLSYHQRTTQLGQPAGAPSWQNASSPGFSSPDVLNAQMRALSIGATGSQSQQAHRRPSQSDGPQPPLRHPVPVEERVVEPGGRVFESAFDPTNAVRTRFQTAPAEEITDPSLFGQGVRAYRKLVPTDEKGTEQLFATFKVREQPRRFFTLGKVFMVLWVEPAGESRTRVTFSHGTTKGRYGEMVYSKVRRFVVIREGQNYCSALPIATYGQRGVGKAGVTKSEHAIIHTGRTAPEPVAAEQPVRGELGMRPIAIRVDADDPEDKLDPMSRIDFGKVHTIQHNIKVRSYGKVNSRSMEALVLQFGNTFSASPIKHSTGTTTATSTSAYPNVAGPSRANVDARSGAQDSRASSAPTREASSQARGTQTARSSGSAGSQGAARSNTRAPITMIVEHERESDDDEDDEEDDGEPGDERLTPQQQALYDARKRLMDQGYTQQQAEERIRAQITERQRQQQQQQQQQQRHQQSRSGRS